MGQNDKQVGRNNEKIKIHWNTELVDVLGDKEVTGVRVVNNKTQEEKDIAIKGLFLAIGHTPNSTAFVDWLDHDENGYLITKSDSAKTNIPGVFACGDVQDHTYRQAVTAAGTGCMSAIDAERWLEERKNLVGKRIWNRLAKVVDRRESQRVAVAERAPTGLQRLAVVRRRPVQLIFLVHQAP